MANRFLLRLCAVFLTIGWAGQSQAQIWFTGDVASGNFNVHATCPNYTNAWCDLVNASTGAGLGEFAPSQGNISVPQSGLAPGSHRYVLTLYQYAPEVGVGSWYWGEATAVVTGGAPMVVPPVEDQEDVEYVAKVGDYDSDGRPDLYIARADGELHINGTLSSFILLRQSSGGFIPSSLSAAQAASAAAGWSVANLRVQAADVNLDYYADVVIGGVGSVIAGAPDVIAYAPATAGQSAASGVKVSSPSFLKFLRETESWTLRTNYFEANAPIVSIPVFDWVYYCIPYYHPEYGYTEYCNLYYLQVGYALAYDFGGYNSSAVGVKDAFDAGGGRLTASGASQFRQILDAQFGTAFGFTRPVPYPNPYPLPYPDASEGYRSPWLHRLLKRLVIVRVVLEGLERIPMKPLYHYTTSDGLAAILSSGNINPPNSPLVYATQHIYRTSNMTRLCLSLDKMPTAAVVLPDLRDIYPWFSVLMFSQVVAVNHPDGTYTPGGGWETTLPKPVPIATPRMPVPRYFDVMLDSKVPGQCVIGR